MVWFHYSIILTCWLSSMLYEQLGGYSRQYSIQSDKSHGKKVFLPALWYYLLSKIVNLKLDLLSQKVLQNYFTRSPCDLSTSICYNFTVENEQFPVLDWTLKYDFVSHNALLTNLCTYRFSLCLWAVICFQSQPVCIGW